MTDTVQTHGPEATQRLGESLAEYLLPGDCIPLIGEMGCGKTCFVQGIARGLCVPETMPVNSPSFTLVNRYPGRLMLFHVDLYRLNSPDQLDDIELDELIRSDGVILIEWPAIAADKLTGAVMWIEFAWDMTHEMVRRLTFRSDCHRFKPFFEELRRDCAGY